MEPQGGHGRSQQPFSLYKGGIPLFYYYFYCQFLIPVLQLGIDVADRHRVGFLCLDVQCTRGRHRSGGGEALVGVGGS